MARPPLLEIHNNALPWLGAQTPTLHLNHLELSTSAPGGSDIEAMPYTQIARVVVSPSLMSTDLLIETTGGNTLRVLGLRRRQAREAHALLMERLYSDEPDSDPTVTHL